MQTLINIIVTLGLLFWASGVMFSPMMLGAPGAANRLGTWWFYIILFLTPVVIFALYWIFGGQFWGITGDALTKGFLILFVAAMLFFNVPLSMWNIYKGISNDGYSVNSQGVYYKGALIDGADGNSFTEFSEEQQGFYADNYARDAKYLYYNNKRVADADPDTFRPISEGDTFYYRDKTHVIYEDHIIQGADANTFREAAPDSNYYVDTNSVFYIDRRLDDVAAEHFEVLISAQGNSGYGVERKGIDNRVFFYGKLIEGADGASFQFTSNNQSLYVQDNNAVYYLDKVVPGAQPECFHAYPDFGEYGLNICDNALAVFYRGKPLNGANPKSFKLVDSDHKLFRDEDKAYIEGKEVFKGLDIGSIKMMDDNYIVDKNGAYIANTKTTVLIENADPKTFKTLGKGYAKDKNHVYHYNYSANAKVIKGADPKTFVVTRFNENVEYDAKDAQHQYRWGRRH